MVPTTIRAVALWAVVASAQYTIDSLSFGNKGPVAPDGRTIPGWQLAGEGHEPQLLSDRVILTPPYPGSTRGSLWAEHAVNQQYWTTEMAFRASGQERGSGNLQFWYVKEGRPAVGANSVYTVGNFDGLVITVDQYGGKGGTLRAFLNDGTTSYKDHHNIDALAFGHCDFPYRNLGRPSGIRVTNDAHGFKVDIDGHPCFSTNQVDLPTGYFFGITAATADNPDSFEVTHVVTSTTSAISREEPGAKHEQRSGGQQHNLPNAPEQLADLDASTIKRQEEQFADLHNRLQGLSHQVANVFGEFERISRTLQDRHNEVMGRIPKSNDESFSSFSRRLENIERTVDRIQRDVEGRDYKEHFTNLQSAVEGVRGGISDKLPDTLSQIVTGSAPRIGTFVLVVIAVQVMLLGAYIVYKRRRDSAPKKYL